MIMNLRMELFQALAVTAPTAMDRCSASTLRRVAHTFGIDRKKVRNMLQVGRGQEVRRLKQRIHLTKTTARKMLR